MPDKKVIFCEGIHDVIFLSILMKERKIKHQPIYKEDLSGTRERTPENNAINRFLGRKGKGYKVLIKDEGGNAKCIDNFINLYEDKDERYMMILCLDSDSNNLRTLKRKTSVRFKRDILDEKTENFYLTKDSMKHRIFFVPGSLEKQVQNITGKNIDGKDRDTLRIILSEFVAECKKMKIDWFLELGNVLFNRDI